MSDTTQTLVEIRELGKNYMEGVTRHEVVRQLDLFLRRGEAVALLGKSGSGKTTLLNLISGIDVPDSGRIIIDGTVVSELPERERTLFRRNHLGFVFQFFNLIPTLTVIENLLLPMELLQGRVSAPARERAQTLLERVGLVDRASTYPDRLSGGEQQRIAVARAIMHRPKLILADEPTGNLDEETGRSVMQLLQEMVQSTQASLLMVTHSREVAATADRVLRMRDGQLHDVSRQVQSTTGTEQT
ncbi:MAG: ABC transporter ATP-binding protein [Gammaproteobacteria bacterium SG8_47]|nr:MAG: ABC transporter ATP-binding protein [Gammaproteobacteria bacterium SG8_47]